MESNNLIQKDEILINLDNYSLDKLLDQLLYYIRKHISCDAGTIYLREKNYLKFHIFQNDSLNNINSNNDNEHENLRIYLEEEKNNNLIAIQAYTESKIITVNNLYENNDYDFKGTKEFDLKFNYKSNNMLVIPLINPETKLSIGVIQLINKKIKNEYQAFNDADKEYLKAFATLTTISIMKLQNNIFGMQSINNNLVELNKSLNKELLSFQNNISHTNKNLSHLQIPFDTIRSALKSIKMQKELNITDNDLFKESLEILNSNLSIIEKEILFNS